MAAARRAAAALAGRLLNPQLSTQQLRNAVTEAASQSQTVTLNGVFPLAASRTCSVAEAPQRGQPTPASEQAAQSQRPATSGGASQPSTSANVKAAGAVSFYKRQLPREVVAFASPEVGSDAVLIPSTVATLYHCRISC